MFLIGIIIRLLIVLKNYYLKTWFSLYSKLIHNF
jgi:hypothetical protein